MNLYEYQGKKIFQKYSIPTTRGILIDRDYENDYVFLQELQQQLKYPVVIKAQVKVGGRGKAGGIKIANNSEEFMKFTKQIFSMDIKGIRVNKILIDEYVPIEKEFYMSFIIDRSLSIPVFIFSPSGGVDIEEVAEKYPEKISKEYISNLDLFDFQIRNAILRVYREDINHVKQIESIALKLYRLFRENNCVLAEINPLVLSGSNFIALDSKIILDENAIDSIEDEEDESRSPLEEEAKRLGLAYVELDGNIGVIGNGAGLVMYTIDLINLYGGKAANFLDIGGGARADRVKQSVTLVLKNPKVKGLFINIFGGITRCDEVAYGIIEAYNEKEYNIPLVVRLQGTNYEEGKRILEKLKERISFEFTESAEKGAELITSLVK
ncbi:MAG: ADP-forming succinate--CoA ligase subunit beta [Candidatus Calescibacterium sp.]|nr:ADP-forming succinate--CoA ligase subunit beta [Candidatus Calescibacterium sp.]MCX7971670.1 ADP-forming succinate--CoA ligase subunit beta [bacterium]MDW8195276.1 ADP-forming succinate--CoA ligase subunit beta [Candidatus Calescibacterium sp.]